MCMLGLQEYFIFSGFSMSDKPGGGVVPFVSVVGEVPGPLLDLPLLDLNTYLPTPYVPYRSPSPSQWDPL